MPSAATFARLTRSGLLDVLGEDFIRVARAKGVGARRLLWTHALRAAITPVVTAFSLELAHLLDGAVLVETIFGRLAFEAVTEQDRPVIMGCALLAAVLANLVMDLLHPLIDPRVRAA